MRFRTFSDGRRWGRIWFRRKADVGAIAFIIGFFVCFFGWLVLDQKFSVASDSFNYSFPMRTVAWQMIRSGTLPLWTPHILSGYPLLPMQQLALGYPLTWGYLFLPNVWAEQIYLLAPFILGPAFTYAYLRVLNRSRTAALLGCLVFGYGGLMVGVLGLYGFTSNSIIWLPLFLIAIERSRCSRFVPCLLLGTASFALSLLSGYPQGSAYVAVLVLAYAVFVSLGFHSSDTAKGDNGWLNWDRWRPLAVAVVSFAFAFGFTAFQLLETMRAVRRSARVQFEHELFQTGTKQLLKYLLGSLLSPVYYWEIPAYVTPLALCFAGLSAVALGRRHKRDLHVLFWLGASVVVWLLLTASTPLTLLFNRVPIFRSFQNPLRHSFEWAFAVGVLSAYGWDYLAARVRLKRAHRATSQRAYLLATTLLSAVSLAIAVFWSRHVTAGPSGTVTLTALLQSPYIRWKVAFIVFTVAAVYLGQHIVNVGARSVLLLSIVALGCFVEAHISVWQWWRPFAEPAVRYKTAGSATRFLQQFPPETNRVYTRVNRFVEELTLTPRLDPPNVTALYNLHNVAGAEPLILDRYSRALGGVLDDAVSSRYGAAPNLKLFGPRSHVLDLLNTRFVVAYAGLSTNPEFLAKKEDVKYTELNIELLPGASVTLNGVAGSGDELSLVTSLSHGSDVPQDTEVARVRIVTEEGESFVHSLRAGVDTAEWAHDRPDVQRLVPHQLARIFDDFPGDAVDSFKAHRYVTRLPLGRTIRLERIEITSVSTRAVLNLTGATLINSASHTSTPLIAIDPERWQAVYNHDDVLILRNSRTMPRAWLVCEAEATDGEEALRRISGETSNELDPRRTVLLEVAQQELPVLPGGWVSAESYAQIIRYEPSRLLIETESPTATVLVLSEIFYPGWEATLDTRPAPIHIANFLLRGVALPAGHHVVEMRYTAPAARNGLMISIFTLLVTFALIVYDLRTRAST